MIKIPFAFLPPQLLYKYSRYFLGFSEKLEPRFHFLTLNLEQTESRIKPLEYISMCLASMTIFFAFCLIVCFIITGLGVPLFISIPIVLFICLFVFMQQMAYPKLVASRRIRGIEINLLPALQDMYIQLNAGVPLFNILVNIAHADYGGVSEEFSKGVREISAGRSQVDVLEEMAVRNPSVLFRRALWQLVSGMKEGSDISSLIKEVMQAVSDEQLTQIQRYGGQLSPLALFYMLIAIIAPSLGITFIIILSSFIALSETTTKAIFYALFIITLFFQIMFLGMIKTRRPTLIS